MEMLQRINLSTTVAPEASISHDVSQKLQASKSDSEAFTALVKRVESLELQTSTSDHEAFTALANTVQWLETSMKTIMHPTTRSRGTSKSDTETAETEQVTLVAQTRG